MMSSPRKRLIGLCLVASFLSMGAPAYATKPVVGSDVFPEPRVITIDRNLPEQSMSLEVQAAIRQERNQPRRDLSGRIHYMVDLVSDVTHGHSADTPVDQRLGDWHKPAMYSVTHAFEARYNLKATGMISWVGNGFSAYLTPEQLNALQRDPLVTQITEDHDVALSAVWSDQYQGSEFVPWNITAVGGNQLSSGLVRAYVLDSGVGYHSDLLNVIARVSANAGIPVVGCYPHSTHVAGILSAARNNMGVVGVAASVPLVSVSVSDSSSTVVADNCGIRLAMRTTSPQ